MRYLVATLAALMVLSLGYNVWQRHNATALRVSLASAQTQAIVAGFETSSANVSIRVITHYVDRVRVVHDIAKQTASEVPRYVTPSTDRAYPLPVGFVRVHDAAATGALPGPAGPADADASPVAASTAATVIAGNYGTCHEIREQLTSLQEWVREQQALEAGR